MRTWVQDILTAINHSEKQEESLLLLLSVFSIGSEIGIFFFLVQHIWEKIIAWEILWKQDSDHYRGREKLPYFFDNCSLSKN